MDEKCNCNRLSYRTSKKYYGVTQIYLKERINVHFVDVQQLIVKAKTSNNFAKFFQTSFIKNHLLQTCGKHTEFKIISQIIIIDAMTLFDSHTCPFCTNERLTIVKTICEKKEKNY